MAAARQIRPAPATSPDDVACDCRERERPACQRRMRALVPVIDILRRCLRYFTWTNEHSRCFCGRRAQPNDQVEISPCVNAVVYGVEGVLRRQVERNCRPYRNPGDVFSAGPDLDALGVFAWSNKIIFTHDLADGFSRSVKSSSVRQQLRYTTLPSSRGVKACGASQ